MNATLRHSLTALAVVSLLIVGHVTDPTAAGAPGAAEPSDFNGDGYADLAIGVPGEDLAGHVEAGAVNVLYGSATGPTSAGDQLWTQDTPGVKGRIQGGTGEYFGHALASGDFDRDGYADLAIGVPRDHVGTEFPHPGAVNVLYGSPAGLRAARDQRWSQANLPGHPDRDDEFGDAVAAGDFDGDGYWDLAIGVRGEAVAGVINRGTVQVLYGGPDGLTASGTQRLTRAMTGAAYHPWAAHWFGNTLAAGDLDGDGFADLAVGAPGAHEYPGDVSVFPGTATGLAGDGSQLWSQSSTGLEDDLDADDWFGGVLAIGNWNGDTFADLAIGVEETFEAAPGYGRVQVLYGTAAGLSAAGTQSWSRESPGVPGSAFEATAFGIALASGDLDLDGYDELAVGADVPDFSGEVVILGGSAAGLTATDVQLWTENSAGVPGSREVGDRFGYVLAAANFGQSGREDLAIGAPGEGQFRGRVILLFGAADGLTGDGAQAWSQDSPGIKERSEAYDFLGDSLAP